MMCFKRFEITQINKQSSLMDFMKGNTVEIVFKQLAELDSVTKYSKSVNSLKVLGRRGFSFSEIFVILAILFLRIMQYQIFMTKTDKISLTANQSLAVINDYNSVPIIIDRAQFIATN
jgi:hypothetical protein